MVKNMPYQARPIIVALLLIASLSPQIGQACAPVPRPGQFVRIAEESAIIFWDETTRTEHFIRRATFDTDAPDFGFLVPTPTKPDLFEVNDSAFNDLEFRIRPKEIIQSKFAGVDFTPLLFGYFFLARGVKEGAPMGSSVRVLSSQRVAGYDAVVLEADNAAEMNNWLGKHGYDSNPSLTEWLAPYVASHWKITAFKIAKDDGYRKVGTSAVRMSFNTDRPFFPYREPAIQREAKEARTGDRLLRVFLLSGSRMDGTLGEKVSSAWPGKTVWADRLSEEDRERFRGEYLDLRLPINTWLTVFEDKSSPRPGTDEVYFTPSKQQETVELPPVIKSGERSLPIPLDVTLILIGGLILVMRRKGKTAK